jgi:hypothetical protein
MTPSGNEPAKLRLVAPPHSPCKSLYLIYIYIYIYIYGKFSYTRNMNNLKLEVTIVCS